MRSALSPEIAMGWEEFLAIEPLPHVQICWMIAQLISVYFNRTRNEGEPERTVDEFMIKWGRQPVSARQSPDEVLGILRGLRGN